MNNDEEIRLLCKAVLQLDRLNNNMEKMLKVLTAIKDESYGK